jgi:sulfonate transport system substrate-binding protein
MMMAAMKRALAAAAVLLAATLVAGGEEAKPELSRVRLAVGGKPALFYLPLTVTERLGYFRDAGLDVEISDFPGGARALQALIGGSADVVTGAFDHTIQMQAKHQPIVAVVQLGEFPGYVLAVLTNKAQGYRSPADLKGMKIGVTAPGSSTHFMVQHLMVKHGLKRDDASFVGIGASASAVAAVQRGEIDAIVNVDPVINLLESQGLIKVVADTRTLAGTREVFGGAYPAAVLYAPRAFIAEKPRTTQALVNALVRALKWIASRSAEEVAAVMPSDYALGNAALYQQSVKTSLPMYSRDGRFSRDAADTAYAVLKAFDPDVGSAKIDVARPTPTHSWRRRRPNPDGGAPSSRNPAASPFIPAPAFAGVNSSGNPRLRVPGERTETRDPETRSAALGPRFRGDERLADITKQTS